MLTNILQYKSYFFDCDGVVLDSNQIKSDGFYQVGLPYGHDYANRLRLYHQENGGISRYVKLRYFLEEILGRFEVSEQLNTLQEAYAESIKEKLYEARLIAGLRDFLDLLPKSAKKYIVSGSDEDELNEVFTKKGLKHEFDGIYGSPRTKWEVLEDLGAEKKIEYPAVFFGDAKVDYLVAKDFEMDFVFINEVTDFTDWQDFFREKEVIIAKNFCEFVGEAKST